MVYKYRTSKSTFVCPEKMKRQITPWTSRVEHNNSCIYPVSCTVGVLFVLLVAGKHKMSPGFNEVSNQLKAFSVIFALI